MASSTLPPSIRGQFNEANKARIVIPNGVARVFFPAAVWRARDAVEGSAFQFSVLQLAFVNRECPSTQHQQEADAHNGIPLSHQPTILRRSTRPPARSNPQAGNGHPQHPHRQNHRTISRLPPPTRNARRKRLRRFHLHGCHANPHKIQNAPASGSTPGRRRTRPPRRTSPPPPRTRKIQKRRPAALPKTTSRSQRLVPSR